MTKTRRRPLRTYTHKSGGGRRGSRPAVHVATKTRARGMTSYSELQGSQWAVLTVRCSWRVASIRHPMVDRQRHSCALTRHCIQFENEWGLTNSLAVSTHKCGPQKHAASIVRRNVRISKALRYTSTVRGNCQITELQYLKKRKHKLCVQDMHFIFQQNQTTTDYRSVLQTTEPDDYALNQGRNSNLRPHRQQKR